MTKLILFLLFAFLQLARVHSETLSPTTNSTITLYSNTAKGFIGPAFRSVKNGAPVAVLQSGQVLFGLVDLGNGTYNIKSLITGYLWTLIQQSKQDIVTLSAAKVNDDSQAWILIESESGQFHIQSVATKDVVQAVNEYEAPLILKKQDLNHMQLFDLYYQ